MKVPFFKIVAQNKKALHDYFLLDELEVGIELKGTEVKSIRLGKINLKDSWCSVMHGQLFLNAAHISPYEKGNIFNSDPLRVRRLLAHKKQIIRISGQVKKQGLSIIPTSAYFKGKLIKLKIHLCKGKKLYDKRANEAKRDAERNSQRAMKEFNKK